jgi:transcription elongation factor GreA-like protein|tara:strand:+ start:518 stop:778 length:261 start_codon:yes stop_codon:yes gene_type:complete
MYDREGNLAGIADPINKPEHYNTNTIETIDLIKHSMETEEFKGYLKGNIIKYIGRYRYKEKENPEKDLLKARWYLERLIGEIRNDG